ncbi:ABC transporter ATP-binding protein [Thermosulfurimonas dismutans]|uniref:ABC transporter, ATP-binding protein n=1 Tax=Thermosulfurimonas dismutans TaxID=999894 RepID=A0A179D2A7_9BACT|nr:ABC transporter ATP-binding protein [Thermosulfurimonas dismutans]OAQ20190.1 ABC transporter, ATP-binding protein [Thermosulfurimonas dismutans]
MVEAQGLTMHYGPVVAVSDLSFKVDKGEILGLLGPNGAGKTTILKILSTQIVPTAGTARINGLDVLEQPERVRSQFGYLPENPPLYNDMEVEEYLSFVAAARGLSGTKKASRLDWVISACGLSSVLRKPIGTLSKGFRQRVGLAQALIHDPPVLILDEPTTGLDPLQIAEMRKLIRELARDKAVIFSTHILQEVEALADRVLILNQGRMVACGTQKEIYRLVFPKPVYRVVFEESPSFELTRLSGIEEVVPLSDTEYRVIFEGEPSALLCTLCDRGARVRECFREALSLEEIFLRLVEES